MKPLGGGTIDCTPSSASSDEWAVVEVWNPKRTNQAAKTVSPGHYGISMARQLKVRRSLMEQHGRIGDGE